MDRVTVSTPENVEGTGVEYRPAAMTTLLTVSGGLFVLIVLLAAVLRLTGLGNLPLSPGEAESALAVWRFWQPETALGPLTLSPVYFSLTGPLLQLLGDTDVVMRLVPALAGLLLVALPWLWRHTLGTGGALITSLLLAISPTTTILAHTAGGDAFALAAILALVIGLGRYWQDEGAGWLYLAAAALGAGLTTSPLFYSGLLTLGLAWFAWRLRGGPAGQQLFENGRGPERATVQRAGLVALLVFLALGTMALAYPAGLGAVAAQPGLWLRNFFNGDGTFSGWLAPLLALVRYEPALVVLGAFAILWAAWRGRGLPLFLVLWFTAALLIALLQPGTLANVGLMVLPASLLLGLLVERVFSEPAGKVRWLVFLTLVIAGAIAYFNTARFLRLQLSAQTEYSFVLLAFIALALAVVIVNFIRSWDPPAAVQGTLAGLLLLLLFYQWGTAWWLTHDAANDPRELWVTTGTDDEAHLLADLVGEISQQTVGVDREVSLLVAVDHPVLRWYLRHYENAIWGETVPPGAQQQIIITPATGSDFEPGEAYFGTDLSLLQQSLGATGGASSSFFDTLRWWLFHESTAPLSQERLILWVRSDAIR